MKSLHLPWSLHSAIDRAVLRNLVPWSQRRVAHLALARLLRRDRTQVSGPRVVVLPPA